MNVFNSVVLPMPAGPVSATTRGASPARTRASSARSVSSSGRASVEVSAFVSLTPACCHSTSTLRQSSVSRICGGSQKWRVAGKHGDRTRTTTLHTVRAYHSGQEVHRAARDPCLPEVAGDTDSGHEAGGTTAGRDRRPHSGIHISVRRLGTEHHGLDQENIAARRHVRRRRIQHRILLHPGRAARRQRGFRRRHRRLLPALFTAAVATLPEILTRRELEQARIIKIDVEGMEFATLLGMTPEFSRTRPDLELVVEISPDLLVAQGYSAESLIELLARYGFNVYRIMNDYAASSYLDKSPPSPPMRWTGAVTELGDFVFSRADAESL